MSQAIAPVLDFCICTYNRKELLLTCIEALLPQVNPEAVMITIVDNNSTDDTRSLIEGLIDQHRSHRYILETNPGLSHARNTGWRSSTAQWIYYLDDDCIPSPDLVSTALTLIQSNREYDAFGGPIYPAFAEPPPAWLPPAFGKFEIKAEDLIELHTDYIRGGNMLIRVVALKAAGGFNESLGVIKNELRYGEELAVQDQLRAKGFRIGYSPALTMGHWVRAEKIRLGWMLRSEYARRRDKMLIAPVGLGSASFNLVRTLVSRVIYVPYFFGKAIMDKQYQGKAAMFDSMQPLAYRMGEWVGSVKRMLRK